MRSSSSSSSSDSGAKKGKKGKEEKSKSKKSKKKDKKEKKDQKKDKKKDKKEDKKEKQRAERAEAWECDRSEAVRLLRQLLQIDAAAADDLEQVFGALDGGEIVDINGLENKQVKKKLRHLLQAMRLAPTEGGGFRTADKKVSFAALFQTLMTKARGGGTSAGAGATGGAAAAAPAEARAAPGDAPAEAVAEASADEAATGSGAIEGAAPAPPPKRRIMGPGLPMPNFAPAGAGGAGEDDEVEEGAEGGPKIEGAERRGVDLDMLDEAQQRPAWMTMPSEDMAGLFGMGSGGPKKEHFEVKRSKKEQEEFEKMMEARGPSLLKRTMEGDFQGHKDAQDQHQKRLKSAQTTWGTPGQEKTASHRPFDPEQDLTVRKPMTGEAFNKLVENSVTGLQGRFGRGSVATSFL